MKKITKGFVCLSVIALSLFTNPSKVYGEEINSKSQLERIISDTKTLNIGNDTLKILENDQLVEASKLYIDGEFIGIFNSKKDIGKVFEDISNLYKENENQEFKILNNIEIRETQTVQSVIDRSEKIIENILEDKYIDLSVRVNENDRLDVFLDKYDISFEELKELNGTIEDSLKEEIDGENKYLIFNENTNINIKVKECKLDIEVFEIKEFTEEFPFKSIEKTSKDLYKGEKRIVQRGQMGIRENKVKTTRDENQGHKDTLVSQRIIKKPVDEIILVGTKEVGIGSGRFVRPTSGKVSSPYGYRWGSFHKGIDIANKYNTPIIAADGGVVVEASYRNSFGNKVTIDHGNGYKTIYAHLSNIGVRVGQKVGRGQYIGGTGSTGNSTGNHLHFEIIINGTNINPALYI